MESELKDYIEILYDEDGFYDELDRIKSIFYQKDLKGWIYHEKQLYDLLRSLIVNSSDIKMLKKDIDLYSEMLMSYLLKDQFEPIRGGYKPLITRNKSLSTRKQKKQTPSKHKLSRMIFIPEP